MRMVGFLGEYTPDKLSEIPLQWSAFQDRINIVTGRVRGDAWGVWFNVLKGGGGALRYFSGVPVGEFAPIHPNFDRVLIAPMHYAVFTHAGATRDLRQTIDAILKQWLPSSGRELQTAVEGAPDFLEHYSEEFNATGTGPIEIWLPIKKR